MARPPEARRGFAFARVGRAGRGTDRWDTALSLAVLASMVSAPALAQPPIDGADAGVLEGPRSAEAADPVADAAAAEEAASEARAAQARELFQAGVAHTQAEEWQEASLAFDAALALRDAPAIRVNLATSLIELARFRDAELHARAVLEQPDQGHHPLAEELLARIRREAGHLRVRARGDTASAELRLDGEVLTREWLDQELAVAPGAHSVGAYRDGVEIATAEITVDAGQSATIALGAATGEVEGPGRVTPVSGRPIYEEPVFWIVLGSAVLTLALALTLGVALADQGPSPPVRGDFDPVVLTWP